VTDNLFASSTRIGMGGASSVVPLDASGDVVAPHKLPA
jgi:hypothetical protein